MKTINKQQIDFTPKKIIFQTKDKIEINLQKNITNIIKEDIVLAINTYLNYIKNDNIHYYINAHNEVLKVLKYVDISHNLKDYYNFNLEDLTLELKSIKNNLTKNE